MEVTGNMREVTANNVDRLVIVNVNKFALGDVAAPLYESARKKYGRSPSLVAAERLIEVVKAGDNVILVTGFASYPNQPYGETDGPPGVASLARAIRFGLNAVPVLVTGSLEVEPVRYTVKAAGLNVAEYSLAKESTSAVAATVTFTAVDEVEGQKLAATIIDQYAPKALISVETAGPNRKGVKHFAVGTDAEAAGQKMPRLEQLFYQATARGILTIGCIDMGNEIGSGIIEEEVRRITPYADVCRCPCGAGIACVVKTDVVFPAGISNWGAYGIAAMLAYLLEKPEILQDADTERRMLEACVMAGSLEATSGQPVVGVDGVSGKTNEALITILHELIRNALAVRPLRKF